MAIFGNFKGTTTSEFKIGRSTGSKISTGTAPSSGQSTGDIFIDASNTTLKVYTGSAWENLSANLPDLTVDTTTLVVNSTNDTVSIGSASSNEKLFVNGNLRLGTNPSLQYSGAYLDLRHSNGSATNIRIRDNASGTDPIFKIYNASNSAEVFKVDGSSTTINNAYTLPSADGSANQFLKTNGSGTLSFGAVSVDPAGSNTQIQFNDGGSASADASLTFDKATDTLQSGVVKGVLFEPISDYGSVATTANIVIDYGQVADSNTTVGDFDHILKNYGNAHDIFTVSALPSASGTGQMIFVSNETGGATMAFSDGTNWRRITDRAVVS